VIEVRAKSNEAKNSHLAIVFNRATVPDGHVIPLHTTLKSMASPAPLGGSDTQPAIYSAAPGSESVRGGGSGSSGMGHGGSTGSNSRGGLGVSTAGGADEGMPSGKPTARNDPRAEGASATGSYVSDALQLHHYPVENMPGVILSSQVTASISGALDAYGQNIRLASGTRMTMDAAIAVPR
jgi:hypothetical protein